MDGFKFGPRQRLNCIATGRVIRQPEDPSNVVQCESRALQRLDEPQTADGPAWVAPVARDFLPRGCGQESSPLSGCLAKSVPPAS